jgi:hypothetical protein
MMEDKYRKLYFEVGLCDTLCFQLKCRFDNFWPYLAFIEIFDCKKFSTVEIEFYVHTEAL